jgi:phosphoribosylformylglycinamidine synthase
MQLVRGSTALSPFRGQKLLELLQQKDASISGVVAEFVHFVDAAKPLNAAEQSQLANLLEYGEPATAQASGQLFLVVPRPGTISPWSSKATDIVRGSGLTQVARVERGVAYYVTAEKPVQEAAVSSLLHDRMTESVLPSLDAASVLFNATSAQPLVTIDVLGAGKAALDAANQALGLAMADDEITYLLDAYTQLSRNPTDVELMMFGSVNSEHCRHKIFNANWVIDGAPAEKSLFKMIRNTHEKHSTDILSAYSDNAAVLRGHTADRFFASPADNVYRYHTEPVHLVIKVETHNHPTAIAPAQGAATGVGGEIRDEGATGRGAKPKMGLAGYSVSNLHIPGAEQPWETAAAKPKRIASPLDIMLEAPIGAAGYANEFGRPNLAGYFRTYEQTVPGFEPTEGTDLISLSAVQDEVRASKRSVPSVREHRSGAASPEMRQTEQVWGYHKPIMLAGGLGSIRDEHVEKHTLPVGASIVVLGGPAMLIGLGGGAASSMQTGSSAENLDFASVQRGNAEIEHRVQEVIDHCWALGTDNPIITIHDVGAGGLSNALPEIVHDSGVGAHFELRKIPSAEPGLTPMEIWCNEAQERYVLGIAPADIAAFEAICQRERCPYAVVGTTTSEEHLLVSDSLLGTAPVDIPMSVLFGKPPKMTRSFSRHATSLPAFDTANIQLAEAVQRVLQLPAVGSKKFLITIGDRSVGGLVTRDQMVGKWQVPVSDVAVTASSFHGVSGEAMAVGERTPLALIDAPASARIAIGEAVTNIASASIAKLSDIKLSANWMSAAGYAHEDQKLYDTVRAVGEDFCPSIGLTIPVGKDSLSMRTVWQETGEQRSVTSPLSLIISAFAPVENVTQTLTPELQAGVDSTLLLIDLGQGKNRLGGSALAQVYNQLGDETPDITPGVLRDFFEVVQTLRGQGSLLAYHDRSDGGLLATVCEMLFASRLGLNLDISSLPGDTLAKLFNEELGVVVQVKTTEAAVVTKTLTDALGLHVYNLGTPNYTTELVVTDGGSEVYRASRSQLESWWARTSYELQKLRDNPICADQEFQTITDASDTGLFAHTTFKPTATTYPSKPKVAIFREQGVNGQVEMAAAFEAAGFTAVDVHVQDLLDKRVDLADFVGLAACGGFSYGDVLGAGEGWAKSILFHAELRSQFQTFFARPDTFSLGVCNGCQMLSALKQLIPGAETWPAFVKNTSEQFEARLVNVAISESPSIFFAGMAGSVLPIPVAHGEGRAQFAPTHKPAQATTDQLVAMRYVDSSGQPTETYPYNPNGSPGGITALTTPDGRATILMPHPERGFLSQQLSWHPADWQGSSPWLHMFQNARNWVG